MHDAKEKLSVPMGGLVCFKETVSLRGILCILFTEDTLVIITAILLNRLYFGDAAS